MTRKRSALLSSHDKEAIWPLARGLADMGWDIYASHNTSRYLQERGVAAHALEDLSGISTLMGGRVKTLHPAIHGGILARETDEDLSALADLGGVLFDLVGVGPYPFTDGLASGLGEDDMIELIDIGGPAMVRAAAKNFSRVLVVVDRKDDEVVLRALREGRDDIPFRRALAARAFAFTSAYDSAVAAYLGPEDSPLALVLPFRRRLRYGTNPHQEARLYGPYPEAGVDLFGHLEREGKPISLNNLADAERALEAVADLEGPSAVIVKHGTPCGAASASTLAEAYASALATDREAAFGGIAAVNRPLDAATARVAMEVFLEVLIAPGVDLQAEEVLAKRSGLRLIVVPQPWPPSMLRLRSMGGNVIVEEADARDADISSWHQAAGPAHARAEDLVFAWKVAKHVASNAIVVAAGSRTLGIGGGQVSRIRAARDAIDRAGPSVSGSVLASDGFIPFPDVVEEAAASGIAAIVEPGGSKGDEAVAEACEKAGIALYFTGIRHFRH